MSSGKEIFEKVVDPFVTGVFAGDPAALSLRDCIPRVHSIIGSFRCVDIVVVLTRVCIYSWQELRMLQVPVAVCCPACAL
jgi:hypothetical protein